MAPSKGIIVLGCFLLTSPVLPPALAPGRAIPALLSLSHPPCALISLHTLNWCCPARPGSFPGFVLSVESGEDSKSLSLSSCLRAPSSPSIPQHSPGAAGWVPALAAGLGMLQGSQGEDRSSVYPQCFLLHTHPGPALPLLTPQQSAGNRECQCWLGMEQGLSLGARCSCCHPTRTQWERRQRFVGEQGGV